MTTQTAAVTAFEAATAIRKKVSNPKASKLDIHTTNLQYSDKNCKDVEKVLNYFQYNVGTSLDCAMATGILRNSITYYISFLIELGLLGIVRRDKDRTTRHWAFHYSADSSLWQKRRWLQLKLWEG